ncbi:MAG: hypothetical protein LBG78_08410 [Azoarcus sp.]|nr:hypothetical protein [Azoarcus sp.]
MSFQHLALFLHLTGITFWVGGMVFIRVCLVSSTLTTSQWAEILGNFFSLSWVSVALIVISGGFMLILRGLSQAPLAWLLMSFFGTVMIAVYASLWLGPWAALRSALMRGELAKARTEAQRISQRLDITLALAALTATVATLGLAI